VSDIFQEVDKELREEKYKTIWNKFKYYIIAIIVLFVFVVGFNSYWKKYSLNEVNDRSARFFEAMELAQQDRTSAISLLQEFTSKEKDSFEYHSMIASFAEAAIRRSDKDFSGALAVYDEISVNDISVFYKDYAKLSAAEMLIALNNIKDAQILLEELSSNSSELKFIAKEYLGYILINEGNISQAKAIFKSLAEEALISSNMKNRAKEILSLFP
tara:strand:+ start:13 stop:657 length:645 start_codon:yes stop_codon:yes gene_type:complete